MKDLKEMKFYRKMLKDLRDSNEFRTIIKGLPEENYIVAGGSLTDAFLGEEFNKEITPNDIDIFIVKEPTYIIRNNNTTMRTARTAYNGINAKYGTLKEVKRSSIFNIIEIHPTTEGLALIEKDGMLSFWEKYIQECFDINICMLFLDFKNDTIISTKSFNEFLTHREMKIIGCLDLFNSFVRCVNKAERYQEFNVKFYKEKWLEIIFYLNINQVPLNLSKTNRNGALFLNLDKIKNRTSLIEILSPMFSVNAQFKDFTIITTNWLSQPKSIYLKFNQIQQRSIQPLRGIEYDINNKNRDEIISMMSNILSSNPNQKERNIILGISNLFDNDEVFNKSYQEVKKQLSKDYSFSKLLKVVELMQRHHNLKNFNTKLLKQGYSINCILEVLNSVNNLRTHKNILIGRLETYINGNKYNTGRELFNSIYNEFLKERTSKDEKLIQELNIESYKRKDLIEEITHKNRLEDEGSSMNHCVGGYAYKIKRKECRVFHINYKSYHSTLELMINQENQIYIRQHYTHMNRTVNKLQRVIAKSFVEFLNKGDFKKEFQRDGLNQFGF